jgi:hypothetical protein
VPWSCVAVGGDSVRHRASDLGPTFDAAGYGGGFDLESDHRFPGGFEPIAQPAPEPLRRGHPLAMAGTASLAVLGVALLIAGATQMVRGNEVGGLALPQPGRNPVAAHQAAGLAGLPHPLAPPSGSTTPSTSSAVPSPAATQAAAGGGAVHPAQGNQLPNTIRLPRGGSAYLVHVEVANDGTLPVPAGVNQAVWWGTGLTAPSGATVFAGHVNWAGATGPFAELWQDGPGDVITIRDNSGTQWRYQVTQVLTLDKNQLPQQAPTLFAPTGPPRIVLATCGGEWVPSKQSYADNRVLVATPIH